MSAMNWRNPSSIAHSCRWSVIGFIWRGTSGGAIGLDDRASITFGQSSTGIPSLRAQRSNPSRCKESVDFFASLAMMGSRSRYLVHHHLVGDAAQRGLFLDRLDRSLRQNLGDRGRVDHRAGDVDLLRGRQALHPGCDIHGLAEVILPLVEHDGETGTFMNP